MVKNKLLLNTEEDAMSFQKACGWSMVKNSLGQIKKCKEPNKDIWQESFRKWKQHGPLINLQRLSKQMTRAQIMKEGIKVFHSEPLSEE